MNAKLPCYPCPHNSICCSWGTSVTDDEAQAIITVYGVEAALEWNEEENGYRTKVINGDCVFFLKRMYYPQPAILSRNM